MKIEETSAIILAGGRSSRMGTDKGQLQLDGKTLLDLMVEKVRRIGITDIVVSTGADGHACPARPERPVDVRYAPDLIPDRGPLSGIHAGLFKIRHRCALVLPVDMPLIPEETLLLLVHAHVNTGDGSLCSQANTKNRPLCSPITALTMDGHPQPLIAVYDASLAQVCGEILQEEKHGPRRLFDRYGYCPVPYTGDPDLLINCNTPEEFALLKNR